MTTRYRFPSQLDYEITSVALADDWLLLQKAGESRQGKCHPSALGFAQLSGGTYTGLIQRVNGMYIDAPGVSSTLPVYAFQFDTNTGLGSSAADTLNFISGGTSVAKLNATSGFFPTANNTYDLGSSTYAWKGAYLQQFLAFDNTNTLIGNDSGRIYFQTGNTPRCGIDTSGHFVPSASDSYNLGSSTYKWKDGHFSGTLATGAHRPQTDNAYDLGSATYSWKDLYLQGSLVLSTTSTLIGISSGGIYFQTNSTPRGGWNSSGNLVPASDLTYLLGGSSNRWSDIYGRNSTVNTSDAREKTDVEDCDLGLAFIAALRPVSWRWIVGDRICVPPEDPDAEGAAETIVDRAGVRRHYGLIAQEVLVALDGKDFAGYLYDGNSDKHSLRYAELIAPLIKAVQELAVQVEALTSRVEALE